jgi:DNA-binding IscR family transcriptional regulator
MKDVVETLEGSLELVGCVGKPKMCRRVSLCVTRNLWSKVSDKISQTLSAVTLDDLVKDYRESSARSTLYNI